MRSLLSLALTMTTIMATAFQLVAEDVFPDGTPIPDWFREVRPTDISQLGTPYRITDHGVANDSTVLQTEKIQAVIDEAHAAGGGVIVVPAGTFLSGSLFFKPGTHLHLEEHAVIKGSDDISHFQLLPTRIEGQNRNYFAALINADGLDGFTISGKGTLDGNGLRYWRSFWLRRAFNPDCTNLDEMRPRVLFVSNSKNVQVSGIRLINSPFWTSHYYKCENVKLLDLHIFAPRAPVKAPSSDAIDLDVCRNVLIKNCYMSVNDDAVALKGGKGPFADRDENNGGNYNILIEDCDFGFCHSALTCGSESIHNRNIILRRTRVDDAQRLLHLKMRPDTPQKYEYILLEDIVGAARTMLDIRPWTQFFDLQGEKDIRMGYGSHITLRRVAMKTNTAFGIKASDQYGLANFTLEHVTLSAEDEQEVPAGFIDNLRLSDVTVNGKGIGEQRH
ncbi:glycoside hydrolase family 28 protein [Parapedobacter sp. 2B3]|uniref:rhamnogalacturonidase n=1 Tax=Parapedobacter sp. 2B3 TaxID=3342381 RepID=UPI0035B69CA6